MGCLDHGYVGGFWEWLRRRGIVRRMAPYKRSDVVRMIPDFAGTVLWYGWGMDPYCNITDAEDMAVPAFGPVALVGS